MKKKYILLLLVTFSLVLLVIIEYQRHGKTNELTTNFDTMVTFHERIDKNLSAQNSLFIGDSLIQGLAVSNVIDHAVNFGIGNDTTSGVIQRLPTLKSIVNARFVILAVGLNDFRYRGIEEILVNYNKILKKLTITRHVVISAVLPVDEFIVQGVDNAKIRQLNIALELLSREYTNTSFLNITNKLTVLGSLSTDYHIGDGVHLNKTGNAIWIESLKLWLAQYDSTYLNKKCKNAKN
ncbi:MAG TPA: hypothetical protein DEO86_11895 [Colwellia sp.]|nr:hypothetical protein [Colwellia sp.]|tara:strand:- start:163 stop:873 length:711 start_codon:yes stop_codon:yes gene_type:complete